MPGVRAALTEGPLSDSTARVSEVGARSRQVYDALILRCTERAEVDDVYTWNLAHFERVAWPGMAGKIRTP